MTSHRRWCNVVLRLCACLERSLKGFLMSFVQRHDSVSRRCENFLNLDKAKRNFFIVTNSRYGSKPKLVTIFVTYITNRVTNSNIPILNKVIMLASKASRLCSILFSKQDIPDTYIGPRGYKTFFMLNSTEYELQLLMKTRIPTHKVSNFKSLKCCIYRANKY